MEWGNGCSEFLIQSAQTDLLLAIVRFLGPLGGGQEWGEGGQNF